MKDFQQLLFSIAQTHRHLLVRAVNALNQLLTNLNWLIGYYILEFEQNGKNRAQFGTHLLRQLPEKIQNKGLTAPELSQCRQFHNRYSQIFGSLTQRFSAFLSPSILCSLSQKSRITQQNEILKVLVPPDKLLTKLSFTHFTQLIKIDDPLKRTIYEIECIKRFEVVADRVGL